MATSFWPHTVFPGFRVRFLTAASSIAPKNPTLFQEVRFSLKLEIVLPFPSKLPKNLFVISPENSEESLKYTKMLLEDVKKAPKGEGLHILWMHMMPFLQEPVKDVFNYSQNVHIRACDFVADGFQRMQASDPYEALAEKMVNCIYNGSVKQRIRRAQELANLTEADGGILFAHWGCKGTIGASSLIKNSLENAGLPTMVLDGDGCNPANSSDGQVSTRLQAYLEMLSEGKEEKRS